MSPQDPNVEMLELVSSGLSYLTDEVVFLGGCAVGFLITDPAAAPIRETKDVDVIAEITSHQDYYDFSQKLRDLGFREDRSEGAPMCRWVYQSIAVDVMPINEDILGFSNKWYDKAMDNAKTVSLRNGDIRMVSAPYFLATKLEAFYGRGRNDYIASHDLEDLIAVLDGRASLVQEVLESSEVLQVYLADAFEKLLSNDDFLDALHGHVLADAVSQSRVVIVQERMRKIAAILQS